MSSVEFVRTLNGDIPSARSRWGLISWEMQEFVSWPAGLLRAQLPVAMGSLWRLMFEGCVVNLENYLDGG